MIDSILNVLVALLVVAAAAGGGAALLRAGRFTGLTRHEWVALSAATGVALLMLALVALAFAGGLTLGAAAAVVAALGTVGVVGKGFTAAPASTVREQAGSWLALFALISALYGTLYLLVALAPTLEGDSIAGYLVTPREYARHGRLVSVETAYTNTFPANGQMLSALGFLFRGQIAAQLLVVWLPGVLAALTLYAFGRRWLSRPAALIGVSVWYGTYSVAYLAASAKVDLVWAWMDLAALLAFAQWYFQKDAPQRWLLLAGFFIGVAGGVKQASAFTAIVLAFGALVRLRSRRASLAVVAASLAALLVPCALALFWVARSWALAGEPFYRGEGLAGDAGVLGFVRTLWDMSMLGNAPALEGPLGKPIGPTVLATMPLLLLVPRHQRVVHLLLFSALVIVFWFNGVQRARHLLPTIGILSLVSGYAIAQLLERKPSIGAMVAALSIAALSLNLGMWAYVNFVSVDRLRFVAGRQDIDGYLEANLSASPWYPNHAMVRAVRALPSDARLAVLGTSNNFYLERPADVRWTQRPADVADPGAFAGMLSSAGITHVLKNDFVVSARRLGDAWLAQPSFADRHLRPIVCEGAQCLFAFAR